jgi:hypothetical protein
MRYSLTVALLESWTRVSCRSKADETVHFPKPINIPIVFQISFLRICLLQQALYFFLERESFIFIKLTR